MYPDTRFMVRAGASSTTQDRRRRSNQLSPWAAVSCVLKGTRGISLFEIWLVEGVLGKDEKVQQGSSENHICRPKICVIPLQPYDNKLCWLGENLSQVRLFLSLHPSLQIPHKIYGQCPLRSYLLQKRCLCGGTYNLHRLIFVFVFFPRFRSKTKGM